MQRIFILISVLISLLLIGCSKDNPAEVTTGNLIVKNRSGSVAFVRIDSGVLNQIPANGSQTFVIDTGKAARSRNSLDLIISFYGNYLQEKTDTISVETGSTETYSLYPDSGLLRINNNCNLPINVSFGEKSRLTIDSNYFAEYKFTPEDGLSTLVTYNYSGLYVLPNTRSTTIYPDVTAIANINPNAGALIISNDSIGLVDSLFMAEAFTNNWGADLLTLDLLPGNSVTLSVSPGDYDIKLIDLFEISRYFNNERITSNQTLNLSYDGLKSAK